MKEIAELIIAALDHFCHIDCPECGKNIAWYEYHTHEEVEKWVAKQTETLEEALEDIEPL